MADAHCGQRCILDTAADGYAAYQQRLPKLAGIQRCAAHVIRRYRAVAGLGPGSLQSWAADVIEILRDTHRLTEEARARGEPAADAEPLAGLRQRYDKAVASGITRNRHRDWHDGNHPGCTLGCWLCDYAGQVWLFTREPSAEWANNVSVVPHPQLPRGRRRRPGRQALATRLRRGLSSHP